MRTPDTTPSSEPTGPVASPSPRRHPGRGRTRRAVRRLASALLLILLLLVVTGTAARAFDLSSASGRAHFPIGTLGAPASVTTSTDASSVDVRWTGVAPPGTGTVGYYVTRSELPGGSIADVCGSPTALLKATPTTCTDTSAVLGTYSYTVTASYRSWTSASDPGLPVVVSQASTTTSLSVGQTTAVYGDEAEVTFTADVSSGSNGDPTGSVDVSDGETVLCSITLPSTTCSPADTALDVSTAAVQATYSGDGTFTGSTSPAVGLTVDPDTTSAVVSVTPDAVTVGYEDTAGVHVSVSTGHGEPVPLADESVVVSVGTASCTAPLAPGPGGAQGTCTIGASALPDADDPFSVSAAYAGDGDLQASAVAIASPGLTVATTPSVTTVALADATATESEYVATLTSAGGSSPMNWAVVSGTLPAGLTLDPEAGVISGAVDLGAVTETFTVEATDQSGASAQATLTLTVLAPPLITTTALAAAVDGEVGYSQAVAAIGGEPDLVWMVSAGVLPDGLSLDSASGDITGNAIGTATTSTFTITVFDANGAFASQQLTIVVTSAYVRQAATSPAGNAASFKVTLPLGVGGGDTLVLSVSQACTNTTVLPATAVDSHVTAVSGDGITWARAVATGCGPDGDAELWYGLGAPAAAPGTKITVTLATSAAVQFADVLELSGITGLDGSAGSRQRRVVGQHHRQSRIE